MKKELLMISLEMHNMIGSLPVLMNEAPDHDLEWMDNLYTLYLFKQTPFSDRVADMCLEDDFDEHSDLWLSVNNLIQQFNEIQESLRMEIARRWLIEGGPQPGALRYMFPSFEAGYNL